MAVLSDDRGAYPNDGEPLGPAGSGANSSTEDRTMTTAVSSLPHPGASFGHRFLRYLMWLAVAITCCVFASIYSLESARRVGSALTASDISVTAAIAVGMWIVCLIPAAWFLHGSLGKRMLPEISYDVRLFAWRLYDRWHDGSHADALSGATFDPGVPVTSFETYYSVESAIPSHVAPPETAPIAIPVHLRTRRPESLLLNSDVMPLDSDGGALAEPWAVGAFFDVVQYGITGVRVDSHTAIATARKDTLDVGVRIAAEIVGTKIPARLREGIEQRQFLVTACVLKHYSAASADDVRTMLIARGYEPRVVWGAAEAYLSGYYHCRSWESAKAMGPRLLRLPPPPRL